MALPYPKIYVPNNLYNQNYSYFLLDNDIIEVFTTNCISSSTETLCNHYLIYPNYNYVTGRQTRKNVNIALDQYPDRQINFANITNDFYYRKDIDGSLLIFLIFFIFMVYFPFRILSRLFGRWLKV